MCLSFVLPRQAGVDINSYRIAFRNFFLLELISACLNSDMKLYAITMKFPHASVAQKLFVTKSSMEKSFFSSFILFSESALPRYESYNLAGSSRSVTKQPYRYFPKSSPSSKSSSCLICFPAALGRLSISCLTITMRLAFSNRLPDRWFRIFPIRLPTLSICGHG